MAEAFHLDISVREGDEADALGTYLVHGYDDVMWTDSIDDALRFLRSDLVRHHHGRLLEEVDHGG